MGKVTGAKALQRNMGRIFKNISEKKAPQFVNAVLSIGMNHAREMQYIEYSTTVNSARTDVRTSENLVHGVGSFNTAYAVYLENNEKLKPRPVSEKKGPATNMNAKPHALRRGFEDSESRAAIKKAESIFKI
jgi:hypothetical protein